MNFNINKTCFHSIVEWFQIQADEKPQNVAVCIQNELITYQELNARANYIAKLLLAQGIEKGDVIAVMTGRSIELIVGIIGVLKSGAAFLPIDISNPAERIKFMLNDSMVKGIITTEEKKLDAKVITDIPIYMPKCELEDQSNLNVAINPEDLAYVIYTSGTTGVPKGVMLENKGLINFINWSYKNGRYDADSVVLQKATCSFDASLYEIFLALLSGSCLQLLSEEENDDFNSILNVIEDKKVTHMVMVPTILSALLDYMVEVGRITSFDNLRQLYIAGEALNIELNLCQYIGHKKLKGYATFLIPYPPFAVESCN